MDNRVKEAGFVPARTSFRVAAAILLLTALGPITASAADEYILRTEPSVANASVFVDDTYVGITDENGKVVLSGAEPGAHLVLVQSGEKSYTAELIFDTELNDVLFNLIESTGPTGPPAIVTPPPKGETQPQPAADPQRRVDVLFIALVVLLVGSMGLLIIVVLRSRTRAPTIPRASPSVSEQSIGHFDRYRLVSTLGSGGVATIYRAFDLIDKAVIALKVLDARWLTDPDMVRKFLAEGEALRSITQRNPDAAVVRCFRYGREHESIVGRPFIALELLEGETLQSRIDRESVLEPLTTVAIAYQIASALVAVHAAGIVHRDLTPDNIFLRKGAFTAGGSRYDVPIVVLIDFGIARQELMSRMTLDGSIAGKPHYMSPEQCRGLTVDTRSDLYSLGIILYLMAAGRLPFAGRDPFEVMRAQMCDAAPSLGANIDARYADLCTRLLAKNVESRPSSATAVAHELEQILFTVGSTSINVVSFPTRRVSL